MLVDHNRLSPTGTTISRFLRGLKIQTWWKWADASKTNRRIALVGVAFLVYGTLIHIARLAKTGLSVSHDLPTWATFYFTALTLLNPLGAFLLARARQSGVALASSIFVTDSIANSWVNFVFDRREGITIGRIGSLIVTSLAVLAILVTPHLWHLTSAGSHDRAPKFNRT